MRDGAQIGVEGFTYSSYAWQPVMTGKIDFLELFAPHRFSKFFAPSRDRKK